ncbi:9857_t:CDS:2, partial [Entrophospora sp. SA101]
KRKVEDSNEKFTDKKMKQTLVPTTPESIAEFLEGQEGVKDDFTKPHQLCENEFNFQRKGRDETLHGIYDYIVEHYFRIKKALDKGKSVGGKTYHRVLAIQATPGGGKSFLLDELAALKNEDFNNYLRSKNHQHPFIIEDEEDLYNFDEFVDDNIERGLVMHILWSYFFDDGKLSWQNFCEKFKTNFESLKIRTAVQSILYYSKKRVLLCIDEIMKILSGTDTNQKQAKVNKSLNHLYNPYQEFAKDKEELIKFNFILTTLDAVYVQSNMTDSGRQIEWIPLRRLEISELAELFNE